MVCSCSLFVWRGHGVCGVLVVCLLSWCVRCVCSLLELVMCVWCGRGMLMVCVVCSWPGLLDMFVVYSRSWCAWRGRGVRGMLVHGARVIGLVICLNSWFTRVGGDDRGYGHELCMYR